MVGVEKIPPPPPPVVQQAARRGVCLFNLHAAPCLSVNTQVKLPGD